jgi:anti-anti-sigma factor
MDRTNPSFGFSIHSTLTERALVLRLAGRSCRGERDVPTLRNELLQICAVTPKLLVVDLHDLLEITSAVLGLLLLCRRLTTYSGGTLRLAGMRPGVRKVLELTGLGPLFDCWPDVESALAGDQV